MRNMSFSHTTEQMHARTKTVTRRMGWSDAKVGQEVQAIERDATGNGLSWASVRRAKVALGVESHKAAMDGGWQWKLAPKMLKTTEDAQATDVSAFGKSERLREPGPASGPGEAEQF